jgi:hypothetical protein
MKNEISGYTGKGVADEQTGARSQSDTFESLRHD